MTIVSNGQTVNIPAGQTDEGDVVQGGVLVVMSGGTAHDTSVDSGLLDVMSGGTAAATNVFGGKELIEGGGTGSDTVLFSGAEPVFELGSGSMADVVTFNNAAFFAAENGGQVEFDAPSPYTGVTLREFGPGMDTILLNHAGFGLATTGTLADAGVSFVHSFSSETAGPNLILNGNDLYWDSDGPGGNAPVLLAPMLGADPLLGFDPLNSAASTAFSWTNLDPTTLNVVASGDFNSDGTTDLMWRNSTSGVTEIWTMQDGAVQSKTDYGNTTGWSSVAKGDFNHDGNTDVMWRNDTSGVTEIWTMQNGTVKTASDYGATIGWSVVSTGDFNDDGTTDMMWRNDTSGLTETWIMQNGAVKSASDYGNTLGWTIEARGDFNGDGTTDVMWRNTTSGVCEFWTMKNGVVQSATDYGNTIGWSPVATGDFNGDGTTDIIWQNQVSGVIELWTMKNGSVQGAQDIGNTAGAPWTTVGFSSAVAGVNTADFNHDGTDDVVWYNSVSKELDVWLMNNGNIGSAVEGFVPISVAAEKMNVVATGDFHGSGGFDIVAQDASGFALTSGVVTESSFGLHASDFKIV